MRCAISSVHRGRRVRVPGGMAVRGLVTMLHVFAALCLPVIAAAIILPTEIKMPAAGAN